MPKKPATTKEMIIEGAFRLVREKGHEDLSARSLAASLGCSTQPIMYQFPNLDALKRSVYERADRMHSEYLMTVPPGQNPVLGIGLNYIRFAVEEPHLFRFLFQSGYTLENSLLEMIDSQELVPVLEAMQEGSGLDRKHTRDVFLTVALFAHGYASLIVNNDLEYDEGLIAAHLERCWNGAVLAAQEEHR